MWSSILFWSETDKESQGEPVEAERLTNQRRLCGHIEHIFPKMMFGGTKPEFTSSTASSNLLGVFGSSPAPRYEWRRLAGETMPTASTLRKHNRVLHILRAQIGDSGEYECRAFSRQGSVSAVITLDIKARPRFIVPLKAQLVDAGSTVTFSCSGFGKPLVNYRWYKNGDILEYKAIKTEDLPRFLIDNNRLTIRNVEESRDHGIYQCEAASILGTALSTAELRVVALAPTFQKHPLDAIIYAANGGNLTVPCKPDAAPEAAVRWAFNDAPLVVGPRVRVTGAGSLLINPVLPVDHGIYSCEGINSLGTDRSHGFLKILRGPRMVEMPSVEQVEYNHSAVLRCTADADPALDVLYEWRLNGLLLDVGENPRFYTGWKQNRGYLFVQQVTYGETGDYTCLVKTPIAQISHTGRLEVIGS